MRILVFAGVISLLAAGRIAAAEDDAEGGEPPVPARIAVARVGEWATYRRANGSRYRLMVTDIVGEGDKAEITVQTHELSAKGKVTKVDYTTLTRAEGVEQITYLHPGDSVAYGETRVKGKAMQVVVITNSDNGKVLRQTYLSDRIPVFGLVKGTLPSKSTVPVLELVDYGFAEGAEE